MRAHELRIQFSAEDGDLLARSWRLSRDGYARRTVNRKPEKPLTLLAHREVMFRILGRPLVPGEIVDHADRNKRNNRRDNLRVVNASESGCNRGVPVNNRSGHKGVVRKGKGWQWQFRLRGVYFGGYDIALEVALQELHEARHRTGYET